MPERISATPLQVPAITRPTPDYDTLLFWELQDTIASPERPAYGSPHPDVEHYLGYLLCKEERLDYKTVRRWYASPAVFLQNSWNYDISFSQESVAHPIYARNYILRREQETAPAIAPLVKLSAFTGVWQIRVTNGGTGYVPDLPPVVTVAAPPVGAGNVTATARAIVGNSGVVSWIVITLEGSGYTTVPAVVIAAPIPTVENPTPSTATAEAKIQLATAKLVKEDLQELPDDDPRRSIFVRVVRIYETLPGPDVTAEDKFDEFGGVETTIRRPVAMPFTPTNTVVGGTVPHVQSIAAQDTVKAMLIDTLRTVGVVVDDLEKADPEVPGSRATVEYKLVLANSAIPADTATVTYERRRYPKDKNIRIQVKTTYAIPVTYTETEILSVAFPQIFLGWLLTTSGEAHFNRPGFSDNVPCQVENSFGTEQFEFPEAGAGLVMGTHYPMQIREAQWVIQRFAGHGLTDEDPIAYADEGGTYFFKLPKSTPTREGYLALAELEIVPAVPAGVGPTPYIPAYLAATGTDAVPQLIGGSSKIWRAGIYRTRKIKTIMR